MLRTGWVVVRRTVRLSWSSRSMVIVSAATWTVTVCPAWMRPRAIFCPATMMTPVLLARRWAVTGSVDGPGRRPGGPGSAHRAGLVPGQRARAGAQEFAGLGVEEHQGGFLDPDRDAAAGEDLPGRDVAPGEVDGAVAGDGAVDIEGGAGLGGRQRRRPGRAAPVSGQGGEVGGRQVRAQRLDPGSGDGQVDDVGAGPEGDGDAGAGGAEPELLPGDLH